MLTSGLHVEQVLPSAVPPCRDEKLSQGNNVSTGKPLSRSFTDMDQHRLPGTMRACVGKIC